MVSLSGFASAFWGFTFILIGLIALAAATGGYNLTRVVLVTTAVYAIVGVI